MEKLTVKNGRYADCEFFLECDVTELGQGNSLVDIVASGNVAAAIALAYYGLDDAPFYYGKIANENGIRLAYVLSHFDLYGERKA